MVEILEKNRDTYLIVFSISATILTIKKNRNSLIINQLQKRYDHMAVQLA